MYITIINILVFIFSIAIVIIIIIIIVLITIIVITVSIIIVFVKYTWRIGKIRQLSPAVLVSHNFRCQTFAHFFFIYLIYSKAATFYELK